MACGNFAFLEHLNPDVYEKMIKAEKKARLDFRGSGQEIRPALEGLLSNACKRYRLKGALPPKASPYDMLALINSEEKLKAAGYLKEDETLAQKRIFPELEKVSYLVNSGAVKTSSYYDFMRRYCNGCSHEKPEPYHPKICYDNLLKVLEGMDRLLRFYYRNNVSASAPPFDATMMPIGEYYIDKAYVPADKLRSKCAYEFLAHSLKATGEIKQYALLRLYNKADVQDCFLLRNDTCFQVASESSFTSVPEGMVNMRPLTDIHSTESSFYIMSYIFNREPSPLSNEILQTLTIEQRIKMCYRIANAIYQLHTSDSPIAHRMINYESILGYELRGEWNPFITKLDFAKIEGNAVQYTVQKDLSEAVEKTTDKKLEKYIAPEWKKAKEGTSIDWAKADIYSLGILFSDILQSEILARVVSIDELEDLGVSGKLLDILDSMRADEPQSRADIGKVKECLRDELR